MTECKLVIRGDYRVADKLEVRGVDIKSLVSKAVLIMESEGHIIKPTTHLDDIDVEIYARLEPIIAETMTESGYHRLKKLYLKMKDKFEDIDSYKSRHSLKTVSDKKSYLMQ